MSLNSFETNGNKIFIMRDGWDKVATTTYREDYYDELISVTWRINNGYLYNAKLGYLHRYIVAKWYGEEVLEAMSQNDFVVDHMDNNSFNCCIENLSFLSSDENKAKGFTVDKQSAELWQDIALNMFKDFSTGCYQTTLFFNKTMHLTTDNGKTFIPISCMKFLYTADYEIVINDARAILLDYKKEAIIDISKLHYNDIRYEEAIFVNLSDKDKDKIAIEIDGEQYFIINEHTKVMKATYDPGWTPTNLK